MNRAAPIFPPVPQSRSALIAAAENWERAAEDYEAFGRHVLAQHARRQAESFRQQADDAR